MNEPRRTRSRNVYPTEERVDRKDFFGDLVKLLEQHGIKTPEGMWRIQLLAQPGRETPHRIPSALEFQFAWDEERP